MNDEMPPEDVFMEVPKSRSCGSGSKRGEMAETESHRGDKEGAPNIHPDEGIE